MTIIGAYASTEMYDEATNEDFYTKLNSLIKMVPREERIALLGDFNARVGPDYAAWKGSIG